MVYLPNQIKAGALVGSTIVHVKIIAEYETYPRLPRDGFELSFELVFHPCVVCVEKSDPLRRGGTDACVARSSRSRVFLRDDTHTMRARDGDSAVGRAVVDDDDFLSGTCLMLYGVQRSIEIR